MGSLFRRGSLGVQVGQWGHETGQEEDLIKGTASSIAAVDSWGTVLQANSERQHRTHLRTIPEEPEGVNPSICITCCLQGPSQNFLLSTLSCLLGSCVDFTNLSNLARGGSGASAKRSLSKRVPRWCWGDFPLTQYAMLLFAFS